VEEHDNEQWDEREGGQDEQEGRARGDDCKRQIKSPRQKKRPSIVMLARRHRRQTGHWGRKGFD